MPWASVADFQQSETFKLNSPMHGWTREKLAKFVAAFKSVWDRAKRNGADDSKAESLAFPIAYETARRAASAETMAALEPTRHYFAAMSNITAQRDISGSEISGDEYQFNLLRNAKDIMSPLVAGVAFNWSHLPEQQIGAIHAIAMREDLPPQVAAASDKDIQVFFVASYRNDIPEAARKEPLISAEWMTTADKEAIPLTFAASHDPLNAKELGIRRLEVAVAAMLDDKVPGTLVDSDGKPIAVPPGNVADPPAAILPPPVEPPTNAAAKPFEHAARFDKTKETTPMPGDDPPNPATVFEAKVASLTAELDNEKKTRKAAELQAAAFKAEFETSKRVVEELKAAATEQMADMAALSLVHEGKATADQATYFAGLYKEIGREKFETLVASLPRSALGAYAIKAAAQVVPTQEQAKAHKDRLAMLLREG